MKPSSNPVTDGRPLATKLAGVLVVSALVAVGSPQLAAADVTGAELESISIPGKVDTSIGTLEFFDGIPIGNTVETVYDNLDRMRATDVYLDNLGAVSINSILDGFAREGADAPNKIAVFEQLMDSATLVVTANTSTLYAYSGTDLAKDGPTVIEVPPGMLGFLDVSWQRFVGDIGVTGPDKGKGGKYLVLPPGYDGDAPDGYFLLKPSTNRNFLFLRGSIEDGLEPAVENITSGLKIYPLKDASNPPPTEYVNVSGKSFNTVFPNDLKYFEILDAIIQREPIDAIGPEVRRDRFDRYRQGPEVRARRPDEEAVDRSGHARQRNRARFHRLSAHRRGPDLSRHRQFLDNGLCGQEYLVRGGWGHDAQREGSVLLQCRRRDSFHGGHNGRGWVGLCHGQSRCRQEAVGRVQDL
ncbi:DUF1254 domain-containing protein [Allomesorhizobium alhagi]|uniref:DUF1254 domain-containing protein n=1 Tax=Mesorhizobium alhagi CCNWXJ12-2 TaxID=1107882 RepID=H0HZI4_9HYPH|nr:DUF1254 domain-containing protein [Mesorhizobium alhagi]EHK53896.1 hypothetical protein MAXJ12_28088 [Mesorhizobium alhagi CCNWXJ12-2]